MRHDEPSSAYSLLEITPETGRPHQIRVHLAHIGCPVVGDPLYGPAGRPAPRLWLHAYQLTLPHPATGEPMTFTAPGPEVLRGGGVSVGDRPQPAILGVDGPAADGAADDETVMLSGLTSQRPLQRTFSEASPHRGRDPSLDARRNALHGGNPLRACPECNEGVTSGGAIFSAELAHIRDAVAAPDAVRALLRLAVERRAPLAADPGTTIYRLVNAAADGLPGLTADRYGDALVAAIYDDDDALPPRPIPEALVDLLAETTGAAASTSSTGPGRPAASPTTKRHCWRRPGRSTAPTWGNSSPTRKGWPTSSAPARG